MSSGHPLRALMYCSGHTGMACMNKILVLIFAHALSGRVSSQSRIRLVPPPSRKS